MSEKTVRRLRTPTTLGEGQVYWHMCQKGVDDMSSYSIGQMNQLGDGFERAGITAKDLTKLGQSRELLDQLRGLIRGELVVREVENPSALITRPATVDYSRPLAKMIEAGRYDYVNSDITAENFPTNGEGQIERDLHLVHFNRDMSSEEVIAELKGMGLRPATLPELLAFGEKYPDEQRNFPIIALGSLWRRRFGRRYVPCLDGWRGVRKLGLRWFDCGWAARCRFLAVRA